MGHTPKVHRLSARPTVLGLATTALCLFVATGGAAEKKRPPATYADDPAVIDHLNAAITWYKQLERTNESAGQPSDAFFLDNARNLAREAIKLAFQSADAEASLLLIEKGGVSIAEGSTPSAATPDSSRQQAVAKATATTNELIKQTQDQIEHLNHEIAGARGKKRGTLTAQRESLQEQLNFNKVLQEQLEKLSSFMSGSSAGSGGFAKQIENLKHTVPDVFATNPPKPGASSNKPQITGAEGNGLISQIVVLFTRIGDARDIRRLVDGAGDVIEKAHAVQTPLRDTIRSTIGQGRGLASQSPPQDEAGREANRQKMALLTTQLKQISDAAIPLAQEIIVLQESQASLRQWETSVEREYLQSLESFLIRLAFLLAGVGIVWLLSDFWRRATFRYVQDSRRRRQILLVRRFVTFVLMSVVLVLGFVSEFGSLATYAGFLTAGVAVALQTVILSVAAYFFLIGRRGVRVGDRITVSGVTGDVIEVGLVRLYLMELGGAGADLHPTGRVVVVSNSVLFQGAPFFKQIPGTAYAWHEVAVKLQRDSDYGTVEKKLVDAVNSVYKEYSGDIERQHRSLEGLGAVPFAIPSPQAHLQFVDDTLEMVVRYPVVLNREAEIDNKMARQVVRLINGDTELKNAVGSPSIRPAAK